MPGLNDRPMTRSCRRPEATNARSFAGDGARWTEHALEERKLDVCTLRRMKTARRSFGRHDPPNANPGVEVRARDVELVVGHEHVSSRCASRRPSPGTERRSRSRYAIFSAWNELSAYLTISATRRARGRPARQGVVELGDSVAACGVELADHGLRGCAEVGERASFAEELGIHDEPEARAGLEARAAATAAPTTASVVPGRHVERRTTVRRAPARRRPSTDRLGHALHVPGVEAAVRKGGRPDADERHIGVGRRRLAVDCRSQPTPRSPPRRRAPRDPARAPGSRPEGACRLCGRCCRLRRPRCRALRTPPRSLFPRSPVRTLRSSMLPPRSTETGASRSSRSKRTRHSSAPAALSSVKAATEARPSCTNRSAGSDWRSTPRVGMNKRGTLRGRPAPARPASSTQARSARACATTSPVHRVATACAAHDRIGGSERGEQRRPAAVNASNTDGLRSRGSRDGCNGQVCA